MSKLFNSLNLKSVENARDLGGYPSLPGMHVKKGVILRSGQLISITDEDIISNRDKSVQSVLYRGKE